jgi:hypothetical protein
LVFESSGSSNSVTTARIIGYQLTNSSTANNAALGVQVADSSGTLQTRLYINNAGNVGIGTTSPGVALHVDGDIRCDGVYGETDTNTSIQFPGSDVITFNEGGSEAARIDSSGRLLIGTSTATSNSVLQVRGNTTTGNAGGEMSFQRGAAPITAGQVLGLIDFEDAVGNTGVSIQAQSDGAWASGDYSGRLVFSVTPGGASSPTEALRITNDRVVAYNQGAPATVNTSATITAANLKTGIITSTTAAAVTMTLPTGANIEAGFSGLYNNFTFEFSVINTGPNTLTVGANGNTTVGSLTVATGTSARYALRRTGANTFTLYRLS